MGKVSRTHRILVRSATASFKFLAQKSHHRFTRDLLQPDSAQARIFQQLMAGYSRTTYGQRYGITPHLSYEMFRQNVPIVEYEDLASWIAWQRETSQALVPESVLFYEPTSGSSGRRKNIPYTLTLRRSFMEMFKIWAYETLRTLGPLQTGSLFLSVSPTTQGISNVDSDTGGLEDDSDYLSGSIARVLRPFLKMPHGLAKVKDQQAIRDILALSLFLAEDLEVISIWNPSYLSVLLSHIQDHQKRLASIIALTGQGGEIHPYAQHIPQWRERHGRLALLENLPCQPAEWWPYLRLISCWDQGHAAFGAQAIKRNFPTCALQGKGLLATEGPITIPWRNNRFVPLLGHIFLEVEMDDGKTIPLHELSEGCEGNILITQMAGLIRYRLGDRIVCDGREANTPTIRLLGRDHTTMDLVGEKLNETFAARCMLDHALGPQNAHLVPVRLADGRGQYVLVTPELLDAGAVERMEHALQNSFHYNHARSLGQLLPLAYKHCPYFERGGLDFLAAQGMKLGDIKPSLLLRRPASPEQFEQFFAAYDIAEAKQDLQ